jgi:septum formation inhibitor-activating ATPase MinD
MSEAAADSILSQVATVSSAKLATALVSTEFEVATVSDGKMVLVFAEVDEVTVSPAKLATALVSTEFEVATVSDGLQMLSVFEEPDEKASKEKRRLAVNERYANLIKVPVI